MQVAAQGSTTEYTPAPPFTFGDVEILTLPGLDNSGPAHWQTHWERLPHCSRVEFGSWDRPDPQLWVPVLDRAIRDCPRPIIIAAHSLGCAALVWWAALAWQDAFIDKVLGALLVAPPDLDDPDACPRIQPFAPLPKVALPFPSLLVASRDDPYARFESSRAMAATWGSDFVDAGSAGHINSASGLGEWPQGLQYLARVGGLNAQILIAELEAKTGKN